MSFLRINSATEALGPFFIALTGMLVGVSTGFDPLRAHLSHQAAARQAFLVSRDNAPWQSPTIA